MSDTTTNTNRHLTVEEIDQLKSEGWRIITPYVPSPQTEWSNMRKSKPNPVSDAAKELALRISAVFTDVNKFFPELHKSMARLEAERIVSICQSALDAYATAKADAAHEQALESLIIFVGQKAEALDEEHSNALKAKSFVQAPKVRYAADVMFDIVRTLQDLKKSKPTVPEPEATMC